MSRYYFFISILLSFLIVSSSAHSHCLEDQKTLLLQLKNTLKFNSSLSTKLVKWNLTQDCCSWDGVECDGAGHVITLNLEHETIYGGIDNSSSLFGLGYLEKLNLAGNVFGSRIQIYNLTHLTHLNLSNAGFSGQIPIELSRMRSLLSLDLSSIFQSSPSPKFEYPNLKMLVQNLTGLRELYLDGVDISAQGSDWCQVISSSLPNLRILSLRNCNLLSPLDPSLSHLHYLSVLRLDKNNFSSSVPDVFANFSSLTTLSLRSCSLQGTFPEMIFQIPTLQHLDLSDNSLSGSIPESLFGLPSLQTLQLSNNQFRGRVNEFSVPHSSSINTLDLSSNHLEGSIPESFFKLQTLNVLSLSYNFFNGTFRLENIKRLGNLTILEIAYNNLSVDASTTISSLSTSPQLSWLNLASCNLYNFPDQLRNQSGLSFLDLSNNWITGELPSWIWEIGNGGLRYLNLSYSNISGNIPDTFSINCGLNYLDLRNNNLGGKIPLSLANCKSLEVMDVGHNNIDDSFPCMLSSSLRILVLRSNRFHGALRCLTSWPNLQMIDIATNNFNGNLYPGSFSSWRGMMLDNDEIILPRFVFQRPNNYYQTEQGIVKILHIFTYIDFSCNNFQGEIPYEIGDLSSLYVFNLSHNNFTGTIPTSLGKLKQLEVLDLSSNKLTGEIPKELTDLTFLSLLNLSYNKLVGAIPKDIQFQTFSADSYEENAGLCGFPLSARCDSQTDEHVKKKAGEIEWDYVSVALGYIVGLGSFMWVLLCCPSLREKYFDQIERLFEKIFIRQQRRRRRGRRVVRNEVRRH